jgi:hypothetical protein
MPRLRSVIVPSPCNTMADGGLEPPDGLASNILVCLCVVRPPE